MKRLREFLTSPFHLLRPPQPIALEALLHVKLQKRCVGLSRREKDFIQAQVGAVSRPALKELFLSKARGSIFSRPGTTTYAVYH